MKVEVLKDEGKGRREAGVREEWIDERLVSWLAGCMDGYING